MSGPLGGVTACSQSYVRSLQYPLSFSFLLPLLLNISHPLCMRTGVGRAVTLCIGVGLLGLGGRGEEDEEGGRALCRAEQEDQHWHAGMVRVE